MKPKVEQEEERERVLSWLSDNFSTLSQIIRSKIKAGQLSPRDYEIRRALKILSIGKKRLTQRN